MSNKTKAKNFQRVINKLLPEMNADRKGEHVIAGNIIACIKLLNNTLPKEWQFKAPKGLPTVVDDNKGGNC